MENAKRNSRALRRTLRRRKFGMFVKQVVGNRMALAGVIIIAFFILMAVFGPMIIPFDPTINGETVESKYNSPSWEHLLGTDSLGRDVLANLMSGARVSLFVGISATLITMILGTLIGIVSGYVGGFVDNLLMRVTDFFLVLPWLPFCMVLAALFDKNSIWNIILVIGLTGWSSTARIIRSQTLSVKEQQYVKRTISIGAGKWHIMFRHILPNVFPLVFSEAILIISGSILTETSLAFLGLGDPSRPSWGMMLSDASSGAMSVGAWWCYIIPGACVVLVALGFTLMGYAFDEILNPKLKTR